MLIKKEDMHFVPKDWGSELWIVNSDKYCGKILFMHKGKHLSYHKHLIKDEVLFIQKGKIWMTYQDGDSIKTIEMNEGEAFHVTPNVLHQMEAIEETFIYEFSTTHFDSDSIRETRENMRQNVQA